MKLIRRRRKYPPWSLGNWHKVGNRVDFICDGGLRRFFSIPKGVEAIHLMTSSQSRRPTNEALRIKKVVALEPGCPSAMFSQNNPMLTFQDGRRVTLLNQFAKWLKKSKAKWIWFEYDGE